MMVALNHCQIILTSLTSWCWHPLIVFLFSLRFSWFFIWWMIFNWNLDVFGTIRLWISLKPSLLAGFLWHHSSRRRSAVASLLLVKVDVQVPHLLTPEEGNSLLLMGVCEVFRSYPASADISLSRRSRRGRRASLLLLMWPPLTQQRAGSLVITKQWQKSWLSGRPPQIPPQWGGGGVTCYFLVGMKVQAPIGLYQHHGVWEL